ncbi:DUF72 domain-containing protein [Paenibacillus sp. y28]|uniref:DUF72 domain-containing protein n=1 Tax=Paenibacillus sp. y28 TaxID=3129110 RepID=UPI003FA721F6
MYHYKEHELQEWAERIQALASQSEEVCVIFNNNSGGHAAGNAKQLTQMLGLSYEGLAPRQLDLFDGL